MSVLDNYDSYVFICHSSQDTSIVRAIKQALKDTYIGPYFVEDEFHGVPPRDAIVEAIDEAKAVFVFVTPNALTQETRDWINFELGAATALEKDIYAWIQKGLTGVPTPLAQVTTYRKFELTEHGIITLIDEVGEIAKEFE